MNLATYLQNKQNRIFFPVKYKVRCERCLQPESWCYCKTINPIDCGIKFVILIHPLERRRRIATGRMAHLILRDSEIIHGHSFEKDPRVNELINDKKYFPILLHLDETAVRLDNLSVVERQQTFFGTRKLVIFVVDGTWGTASKTVRLSPNLNSLPKIAFTAKAPSTFRVRRQPNQNCYSTIEAIHETIDLLKPDTITSSNHHVQLLSIFDQFVSQQIECVENIRKNFGKLQYRIKKRSLKSNGFLPHQKS